MRWARGRPGQRMIRDCQTAVSKCDCELTSTAGSSDHRNSLTRRLVLAWWFVQGFGRRLMLVHR